MEKKFLYLRGLHINGLASAILQVNLTIALCFRLYLLPPPQHGDNFVHTMENPVKIQREIQTPLILMPLSGGADMPAIDMQDTL